MADTANYGWTKPTVGGDGGAWGGILNTLFDDIDADLNTLAATVSSVSTVASAALPKAGGEMTGEIDVLTARAHVEALGNITGTQALDLDVGNAFTATVTGAVTVSISNAPGGTHFVSVFLKVTNPGTNLTLPGTIEWAGGAAPTFTVSGTDNIMLTSYDGGSTWIGAVQLDVS